MERLSGEDAQQYWRDRGWLDFAVHELPAGVLYGANGATAAECRDLMDGLDGFASLCSRLELPDHTAFIEGCRWHFDHYPHYLSRHRHFDGYEAYVRGRRGPLRVVGPTVPEWLKRAH